MHLNLYLLIIFYLKQNLYHSKYKLNEQIHQISVHPNPLKGVCEISSDIPMESISIMDVSGKLLFEFLVVNAFEFYLDLSKFNNGIYFAKVTTANTSTEHKLILQK